MARKRYKPEEIVAKLRQVDGLAGPEHGGRNPPDVPLALIGRADEVIE
jgi:hypothetical protein